MTRESMLVALRRRWWIVVAFTIIGAVLGALPDPGQAVDATTSWNASHTLLLTSTDPLQGGIIDQVTFNQLQLFATTGEVPKRAAEAIGYEGSGQALAGQVSVTGRPEQAALIIGTTQGSPERAVEIADAFGEELVSYLAERQDTLREQRLAATLSRLDDLERRLKELSAEAVLDPTDAVLSAKVDALSRQYSVTYEQYDELRADNSQQVLTTLGRAEAVAVETPGLSAPRSRTVRGLMGALVGFAVGAAAAIVLARLDRRIRTPEQAESIFGMHAQLAIPYATAADLAGVAVQGDRHDSLSDSYRRLRSVVSFVEGGLELPEGQAPVTLVVSAGPAEGKTSVTANLSAAIAEAGESVIAVNTDFRRPTLSMRLLGRKHPQAHLELDEIAAMHADALLLDSPIPGLSVFDLAGIDASPGDLARSTRRYLPELCASSGSVVIDTSPVGATAEVLELIPAADVIVVVVRIGQTSISAATRAADTLRALSHAETLLVLVGVSGERSGDYYYEYSASPSKGRRGRRRS